ncbi:universal stress protein [uncultured Jatrophihabitans sp.]|uniref:universal stress protein n=1 Tax=uncultured Jatrophihabitans sp. TaxID=1610747 RepID=UPI0035CAF948
MGSTNTALGRRRIVVGVDGSKASIEALQWARVMGTAFDAELDAVLAWEYPASYGISGWLGEWDPSADAASMLEHTLQLAFGDDRPAGITTTVTEGHPANVLVDASGGAELLVVGSRGHGGFVGLLIGATSAHVAEHARCTVLVTHDSPDVFSTADASVVR